MVRQIVWPNAWSFTSPTLTLCGQRHYGLLMKPCYTCTCMNELRVFDKFWSLGKIGSKSVSVCAIENTSEPYELIKNTEWTVMSPGDLVLSKFGENITHLILFRLICLLTSLRPQTYLRLVLSLRGSFLYTRSWNRTRSVRSNSTTLSISGVTKCVQYLHWIRNRI